eukprot:1143013-Pelagomonas_calceolata.AAC.2
MVCSMRLVMPAAMCAKGRGGPGCFRNDGSTGQSRKGGSVGRGRTEGSAGCAWRARSTKKRTASDHLEWNGISAQQAITLNGMESAHSKRPFRMEWDQHTAATILNGLGSAHSKRPS